MNISVIIYYIDISYNIVYNFDISYGVNILSLFFDGFILLKNLL